MVQTNRNKLVGVLWVIFEYIVLNFIDEVISSCKNIYGILSIIINNGAHRTREHAGVRLRDHLIATTIGAEPTYMLNENDFDRL